MYVLEYDVIEFPRMVYHITTTLYLLKILWLFVICCNMLISTENSLIYIVNQYQIE